MYRSSITLLIALGIVLIAVNSLLLLGLSDEAHFGMSLLFWIAAISLVWEKRNSLPLMSGKISRLGGALLISTIILNSVFLLLRLPDVRFASSDIAFVRVSPLLSALGLALMVGGIGAVRFYWRELLILFFLGVPGTVFQRLLTPPAIWSAALFSENLLRLLGLDVTREGVIVDLPWGGVIVHGGCSGLEAMTYLLGISVICLVMFPTNRFQVLIAPLVGVSLGFIVNGLRVALLAILSSPGTAAAFDYWHEGEGSLIVGAVAIFLFCLYYIVIMHLEDRKTGRTSPARSS